MVGAALAMRDVPVLSLSPYTHHLIVHPKCMLHIAPPAHGRAGGRAGSKSAAAADGRPREVHRGNTEAFEAAGGYHASGHSLPEMGPIEEGETRAETREDQEERWEGREERWEEAR